MMMMMKIYQRRFLSQVCESSFDDDDDDDGDDDGDDDDYDDYDGDDDISKEVSLTGL